MGQILQLESAESGSFLLAEFSTSLSWAGVVGKVWVKDSVRGFSLVSYSLHLRKKDPGSVQEGEEHGAGPG